MIRLCLILLVFGLIVVNTVKAQEIDVVEQCVSSFVEPADDWTFDGTIITYKQWDGVHGFRADTPSRYYIAFDNEGEYARFGTFSPDKRWFASYLGGVSYHLFNQCCNAAYYVDTIRVVSTSPSRETYTFPFHEGIWGLSAWFSPVSWQNNSQLIAISSNSITASFYIVNPFESQIIEFTPDEGTIIEDYGMPLDELQRKFIKLNEASFDELPSNFFARSSNSEFSTLHITDSENNQVIDTCITTDYTVAMSPAGNQVAVSGQEGGFVYILDLDEWQAYRLDLAANHVVAWVADENGEDSHD